MSQGEANKAVRVLRGEMLKFTCRVHLSDGKIVEFQSSHAPQVRWSESARCLWLMQRISDYEVSEAMRWPDDAVLLVEENPK